MMIYSRKKVTCYDLLLLISIKQYYKKHNKSRGYDMSRHFMRILALGLSLTVMLSSAPAMVMADEEDGAPVTTLPVAAAREKIDAVLRREAIEDDSILMENQFGRDGRQVLSADVSSLEYTVEIPSAGKYRLWFAYYSLSNGFTNIERRVSVDGGESVLLYLSKHWVNKDEEIQIDKSGNELRPEQIESREWIDAEAKIDGTAMPALFELTAGTHTLDIQGVREDMLISRVYFVEERDLPAYNAYRCMYENGIETNGRLIDKVQGEDALRKSDPMLYPQYDRSSPLTEPVSDKTIRMNTIGGTNWKTDSGSSGR